MKSGTKISIFLITALLTLNSCKTIKYLQIADGSKSDGTLSLVYEYGPLQKPVVKWDQAKEKAIERCKLWGYKSAEFFDVGVTNCVSQDFGGCNLYRVTYKCQCVN